jgi:hypothetical protein
MRILGWTIGIEIRVEHLQFAKKGISMRCRGKGGNSFTFYESWNSNLVKIGLLTELRPELTIEIKKKPAPLLECRPCKSE